MSSSQWFADLNWLAVLKIIWIDILLSGDNAMVIAMACRRLPAHQRAWGSILGAGAAVTLRIILTLFVTQVMNVPWLKLAGGLLLFWVALKLILEDEEDHDVRAANSMWSAVWTIVVADAVMSLDNVLAVAAAAQGHFGLVIFGLLLSIPLVVAGSRFIMWLIDRFPIVMWAGAALLGSLAGGMIAHEAVVADKIAHIPHADLIAQAVGAALVVVIAWIWQRRRAEEASAD